MSEMGSNGDALEAARGPAVNEELEALELTRQLIANLPADVHSRIESYARELRLMVTARGVEGELALALVSAEFAIEQAARSLQS